MPESLDSTRVRHTADAAAIVAGPHFTKSVFASSGLAGIIVAARPANRTVLCAIVLSFFTALPATLFAQDSTLIPLQRGDTAATPADATAAPYRPVPFKLAAPTERDQRIAMLVSTLMQRYHVSNHKLDDQISMRALDLFIRSLDPLKLYFLQTDIGEFKRYDKLIDDLVRQGNMKLAYVIFERFIKRVDQRVNVAQQLLDSEFDFTIREAIVIDPDEATYAANEDEARDRWRRQIKYALLDLKDEGKEIGESKQTLSRRYARYARRWRQTDSEDLLEMFLTSVTTSFDPHSTYMSPGTLQDFQISMRLNLDGIGAQLREKDGYTTISRVIPGGAAAKHGKLESDDVIVSVGQGDNSEVVDIVEMPLTDVVDLIRGKAGTDVVLGVRKGGVGDAVQYRITRARIELEESAARGEIIDHTVPGSNMTRKVGYINLPSFYLDMEKARADDNNFRSSTRDVARILGNFRENNVDVVVLDLSKNGGGSLSEAISLTGLFIDAGPVVQVKNSDGSDEELSDRQSGVAWTGPMVVMTSKFSASASEILAGAIRDYRRGIVVGDPQTHGKGTVQTLMDLSEQFFGNNSEEYGALKVTLQQFYLPDGQSTQLLGVPADVVLPSLTAKMDVGEGDLKFALKHDKISRANHMLYNMVPADVLNRVRANSMSRVEQDEEFRDLLRRIELYVGQKEQNTVSIEEEAFMARRKELDAQEEDEDVIVDAQTNDDEVYNQNFYNDEVLSISIDYLEGLRAQNLAQVR